MDDVVILGAGLAGLGCASVLPRARLFEASDHPGGHAYSHNVHGLKLDEGAHIVHSREEQWLRKLFDNVKCVERIHQSTVRNCWDGRWMQYPVQNHLSELPEAVRVNALMDLIEARIQFAGSKPENYRDWCLFQYGRTLTDKFYDVYTRKYWRVSMEELGVDWLEGRLLPADLRRIIAGAFSSQAEDQTVFTKFYYPAAGGFFGFFEKMYDSLKIEYSSRAIAIDESVGEILFEDGRRTNYGRLVSTIPLPELVEALRSVPTDVVRAAAALRHTQLVTVNMLIDIPKITECHWFYVDDEQYDLARVSVPSNLAPTSVPSGHTCVQAEVFRRMDEAFDTNSILTKTVDSICELFGLDSTRFVVWAESRVVPYAYVISDHRREGAVETITEWLYSKRIYPAGLYGKWNYIWSDAAFASGVSVGQQLSIG